MRLPIVVLLTLLTIPEVQSQNYVNPDRLYYTQYDTGRGWPYNEVKWESRIYRFGKEININGKEYRVLEYTKDESLNSWIDAELRFREDSNVVYWWLGSNRELVMYDWNVMVGDTIPSYLCSKVCKYEVQVQTALGERTGYTYDYTNGGIVRIEIPEIGGVEYPFLSIELCSADLENFELNCVYEGDSLIYKRHDKIPCFRSSTTAIPDIGNLIQPIQSIYNVYDDLNYEIVEGEWIEIYSINGQRCHIGSSNSSEAFKFRSTGMYILRINTNGNAIRTQKIIVH